MFRLTASNVARRAKFSRGPLPAASAQRLEFHVSTKREEDAKEKEVAPAAPAKSNWDALYAVPLGIGFAVPAIHYEWYVINEETQLMACFVAFTAIVYKQFGGIIHDTLAENGKQILEEHNKVEDEVIQQYKAKHADILEQWDVVQDTKDIHTLKAETYEKLNAAGIIKPKHDFKAQIERMLVLMASEEASASEKTKVALMEDATAAVSKELLTNKAMQKASLDNAISLLKGSPSGKDPVKEAYLKYFKWKSTEAQKIDPKAEVAEARANIVTKLNAVAANENFCFKFDANGNPQMNA